MPQQPAPPPQPMAPERQGSRWLWAQPPEPEIKEWFDGQHLHEGMEHAPYYGGIVLIGATEKIKTTFVTASGQSAIREIERPVFTPYVKVDTRIAYFWTLVQTLNIRAAVGPEDDDLYFGVIEPVEQNVIKDPQSAFFNQHLPKGFFIQAVRQNEQKVERYICAQWQVAIYKRQSYLRYLEGKPAPAVLRGIGTKQTNLLVRSSFPDDNAIMKAETGAIGRALGVAGILVVGTGIATAEDIQEAQAAQSMPTVNREGAVQLPGVVGDPGAPEAAPGTRMEGPEAEAMTLDLGVQSPQDVDQTRREQATKLSAELKSDHPEAWEVYLHWYREERKFPSITELTGPALKGALTKLERALDEAKNAPATDDTAPAPAVE